MANNYTKPWLSIPDQLQQLQNRGMTVSDTAQAAQWLERVSYYRLSAYWHPYWQLDPNTGDVTDRYEPGTTFDDVIALYLFDKKLRSIVFSMVETVEVALRSRIGHTLGFRNPGAHTSPRYLDESFVYPTFNKGRRQRVTHSSWLSKLERDEDGSKERFMSHFRDNYRPPIPIWASTEVTTMGQLSLLYSGLLPCDRNSIAHQFGFTNTSGSPISSALASVLEAMTVLRNICGHHSRLWNREVTKHMPTRRFRNISKLDVLQPGLPTYNRPYETLYVLAYMEQNCSMTTEATSELATHLQRLPKKRSHAEMGCPHNWQAHPVWSLTP